MRIVPPVFPAPECAHVASPRRAGQLATLLLACTMLAPAQAVELPPYDLYHGVGIAGFGDQSSQSFGMQSMANAFGSAVAVTGTTPAPFVRLELSSSDASLGAHDASAFGQLGYYLSVVGPAAAAVPVQISASGSIAYSADNANLSGVLKIVRQYVSTPLVERMLCHNSLFCGTTGGDSFVIDNQTFAFEPGARYYVSMVAQATVMTSESSSGSATVFLDPYFRIDPGFANADAYTLAFSPGIVQAPVPEPATAALWLAALAALACRLRRPRAAAAGANAA